MKTSGWDRAAVVGSVRDDVWRFVTQAARHEDDAALEAAALLRMAPHEVRTLAQIQFIASQEVEELLVQMPLLARRLQTTTVSEIEASAERVRGAIQWGSTFSERIATGLPHLYVTTPARRAFDTPENQLLVHALDCIHQVGRRTGWHRSGSPDLGELVRDRVAEAERWLRTRTLAAVARRTPTPQLVSRVRASRARRRYQAALDVFALHTRYVRHLDRDALRQAVEENALVTSKDDVLLELLCGFRIEAGLKKAGWRIQRPGLVRGGLFLRAERESSLLQLYYQHTPPDLAEGSLYNEVQKHHPFKGAGSLIPDFVLRHVAGNSIRWLLVEVKGVERPVSDSARAALQDLLAYRRAFEPVLMASEPPYGLGVAWGKELPPCADVEISLCTPDTIESALEQIFGA